MRVGRTDWGGQNLDLDLDLDLKVDPAKDGPDGQGQQVNVTGRCQRAKFDVARSRPHLQRYGGVIIRA